jgi:hypothetical protein
MEAPTLERKLVVIWRPFSGLGCLPEHAQRDCAEPLGLLDRVSVGVLHHFEAERRARPGLLHVGGRLLDSALVSATEPHERGFRRRTVRRLSRDFPMHLARWLILAQADEDGVAKQAVV